ncbi:MAG: alpha-amylase family glycosyl hydrolase [Ignavibacteriaceae bacterium]|nr:alpha-amylase family glycosyl hydrolase [Ignavibacteriaceae bacterium]
MKKILALVILLLLQNVFASGIKDIIQPLSLTPGKTDTVLISDIFYSDNYNLKLKPNPDIKTNYVKNKYLILTPSENFNGIGLISFTKGGENYVIPYKTSAKVNKTFTYTPPEKVNKVNLFGSFNGWNRGELPMSDKKSPGTYEITIPLDPGSYEYKFFVDSVEVVDPLNREKISNGMGSFNSIINIKPLNSENVFLHVLGKQEDKGNTELIFYYEKENNSPLQRSSVIALFNNSKLPDSKIKIDGNRITISLSKQNVQKNPVIRVVINESSITSNIQTVDFYNGEIAANNNMKQSNYDNIIYALLVDRFYDGDKTNSIPVNDPHLAKQANYEGGDLQGIIDKINDGYFDSLGINMIWLSPVVDNTDKSYQEYPPPHRYYSGYHGYWPISSTRVEERFGNMDLLKKLVKLAHSHNMKVILDYIANHVTIEHPFWKEHRDWFGNLYLPDGTRNLRRWDDYRLTTWFEPFMPKFDYIHSKAALETMTDNAVWWIKTTGIDGFRHDAVKHVPNIFWRRLTEKLKKDFQGKKLIYQIGETFGTYELVSSYVNNGQLDAQFNFLLYDTAIPTFSSNVSFKSLDEQLKKTFQVYGYNNLMGNIMDSNDKVRFMAYADGEVTDTTKDANELGWTNPPTVKKESSYQKLELFLAYLNSIPGIPIIDYGDEIGMTGAGDPDNRRMMRFGADLTPWEKNTLVQVRKIINLRKDHPALRYGDFFTLKADEKNYVYLRSDMNERILIALNKRDSKTSFEINLPVFYNLKQAVNLITNEKFNIINNKLPVSQDGLSWSMYKLD